MLRDHGPNHARPRPRNQPGGARPARASGSGSGQGPAPAPAPAPRRRVALRDPGPPAVPERPAGGREARGADADVRPTTRRTGRLRLPARGRRGRGAPPGGAGAGRTRRGWFIADEPDHRPRAMWLLAAFAIAAIVVTVKLVDLQVRQSASLARQAAAAHLLTVPEFAHRGRILDDEGRLLVSNLATYDVWADPSVIPPDSRGDVARTLSPVLSMGPGLIEQLLSGPGEFVYLTKRVSQSVHDQLAALHVYGVGTVSDDTRLYDESGVSGVSLASNLLGYVDHDGHGQYGVEAYYDAVLRGTPGSYATLRDLDGNPIVLSSNGDTAARDGRDLRLGLDSRVQAFAQQDLQQMVTQTQSESGSIMIMDTHTGSIRAWADYPTYDANTVPAANPANIRDLAVDGLYEPGSVMKTITFAGGLNKGVITPQTTFDEHVQTIDGFTIHDWDGRASHGNVTMQWVLDDSLNNGAIEVMRRTGKDAYYSNLQAFGIGTPTGIDVAGETSLPLRPQAQWTDVDYATASFGQQVAATPVEMLAAVNAIANGGVWVQPHAVDAVVDPATGQETDIAPTSRRVMSAAAAAVEERMMTGVVEDRGASGFAVKMPQFQGQIAGKTGTADVAENGHYGAHVIDSFAGYLPVSSPTFTMLVVLRKPGNCKSHWGGACEGAYLVAPVWKDVAQMAIDTWKIAP
ncbi:MAG TPA: penicillin-binding protein 2 [Candidatus Dormibacteraeota bacterium]|nr:penicillin-binding protein 2 [Candidatus Dormibacteraeota bacterium]